MTPKLRNTCRRKAAGKGADGKRAKLWQAMRILRTFTTFELQAVTESEQRHAARTFVAQLLRAGFIAAPPGNRGSHAPLRYKLIRDTGPAAPWLIHCGAAMYDPNTDTEYPIQ